MGFIWERGGERERERERERDSFALYLAQLPSLVTNFQKVPKCIPMYRPQSSI